MVRLLILSQYLCSSRFPSLPCTQIGAMANGSGQTWCVALLDLALEIIPHDPLAILWPWRSCSSGFVTTGWRKATQDIFGYDVSMKDILSYKPLKCWGPLGKMAFITLIMIVCFSCYWWAYMDRNIFFLFTLAFLTPGEGGVVVLRSTNEGISSEARSSCSYSLQGLVTHSHLAWQSGITILMCLLLYQPR